MTRQVTVAAVQTALGHDMTANIARIEALIREAAAQGAQAVVPPELFQSIYFPTRQDPKWFETAYAVEDHPCVRALQSLASELKVVIPISFFEKDGPHFYNSVAIADADGTILGVYRKSHIPDGPGYQEKYYFRPGNTGFKAWRTKHGTIGVGICWDQWYPEAARAMVLQGAELLLYPTAIGSEPYDAGLDTSARWRRVMQGHAVANAIPVIAANRVGEEDNDGVCQRYYGHSFAADHTGEIVADMEEDAEGVNLAAFDLDDIAAYRADWGFFRDRRTDLYGTALT
ncbi:N-carbamoylputrescine amidase [Methyloceanibacter caenitepidi]|uniref:N-carbamoylputrescine amidase n=1 Tax=Methyloceanibacter caenitepidi TaxID=1384459 RepID=A0A0A8K5H9_9HYPH|nr:N-carbamoylputrescine amidase [Methyloceanibacter caenitepidi]BAQ18203.1 N-carbamoylputrescine amidase [Methyloceanibacter caenitepidi]